MFHCGSGKYNRSPCSSAQTINAGFMLNPWNINMLKKCFIIVSQRNIFVVRGLHRFCVCVCVCVCVCLFWEGNKIVCCITFYVKYSNRVAIVKISWFNDSYAQWLGDITKGCSRKKKLWLNDL